MTGRDKPRDAPASSQDKVGGPAHPNGSAKSSSTSSSSPLAGSTAPLAYVLIRWLFRFGASPSSTSTHGESPELTLCERGPVLRVFYSSVVVEGAEHIPRDGVPCMITANHSNSLTDALLLVTTVPPSVRAPSPLASTRSRSCKS